ncbi:pilus assembly protein [Cupriavidus sp. amp6]|uniref:pilus assembly protein n=1 Tax=Cupriavidus sp. amp6 TaxID=388051 RepID=UPI00041FE7EA|nr:pilus assembly protein [Cupriavidus sp. amp6]
MLTRQPLPARQSGAATLLLCGTMLLLVLLLAAATLQMLMAGRQLTVMQLDREIAFRAAEVALLDGEADLLAAAAGKGQSGRLDPMPEPGHCGTGLQAGICLPAAGGTPVWQPWLLAGADADAVGVPLGRFTGATLPVLPPGTAGTRDLPRYVAELLDQAPAGHAVADSPATSQPGPRIRITAIGFGRSRAVRAVVQSEVQP